MDSVCLVRIIYAWKWVVLGFRWCVQISVCVFVCELVRVVSADTSGGLKCLYQQWGSPISNQNHWYCSCSQNPLWFEAKNEQSCVSEIRSQHSDFKTDPHWRFSSFNTAVNRYERILHHYHSNCFIIMWLHVSLNKAHLYFSSCIFIYSLN